MKAILSGLVLSLFVTMTVVPADAQGCIKGAVVGGAAGHIAGHHGQIMNRGGSGDHRVLDEIVRPPMHEARP